MQRFFIVDSLIEELRNGPKTKNWKEGFQKITKKKNDQLRVVSGFWVQLLGTGQPI